MTQPRKNTARIPTFILVILSALGVVCGLLVTRAQTAMEDFHIDMEVYRAGGRAIMDGTSLYDHWFQAGNILLPFTYPPFGAIIITPLAWFSHAQAASVVMICLSSLLMLLCLFLVSRTLLAQHSASARIERTLAAFSLAALIWPLALLTEPLWKNAVYTQVNALIMTLILLDTVPRKRLLPQGWLIGVAAAIKLTPLVMLLYFLVRKDWRAIATAAASAVLCTCAAGVLRPKDTWDYYTHVLYDVNRIGDVGYATNGSFKGAITRLWPSKQAALDASTTINVLWLACSVAAIIATYYVMRVLVSRGLLIDAVLSNAALMLLISPISWSHHWVWVPLWALLLVWRWWGTPGRPFALMLAAILLAALTLHEPPHWWFGDYFGVEYTFAVWKKLLVMDFTWYAMLFIAVLGVSAKRHSPVDVSPVG